MQDATDGEVITGTDEKKRGNASPTTQPPPSYVLVVDDEPVVRGFLSHCLEEWGYAVQQAASADEALDLMVAKQAVRLVRAQVNFRRPCLDADASSSVLTVWLGFPMN
jgi:PleD family two-component response regulator